MSVARLAYAAARVVMRDGYADVPHSLERPGSTAEIARWIDWETTAAQRARLGNLGFGVAEAMDTAQRFFLGWESAARLIRATGGLRLARGFCAGAGTDHLADVRGVDDLALGVAHQCAFIADAGGVPVLLPMPWLAQHGADEDTYVDAYARILARVDGPVIVHWLGAMFLPALAGYFPGASFRRVMALDPSKVRGAKLSLLDPALEVELRRELLARDQILFTGDDLNFARLILGGDFDPELAPSTAAVPAISHTTRLAENEVALGDFSHALLGVLDGIAAPAAEALEHLDAGDASAYLDRMLPCETLGRHLFSAPTQHYKAGLAHLAHRAGLQTNAMLVNHEERARNASHYTRAEELAHQAAPRIR
jgi:hypothetical protein